MEFVQPQPNVSCARCAAPGSVDYTLLEKAQQEGRAFAFYCEDCSRLLFKPEGGLTEAGQSWFASQGADLSLSPETLGKATELLQAIGDHLGITDAPEPVRCAYCLQPAPPSVQAQFDAVAGMEGQEDVERLYTCPECVAKHGPAPGDVQLLAGDALSQDQLSEAQKILQRMREGQGQAEDPAAAEAADVAAAEAGEDKLAISLQPLQMQAFQQFTGMMQAHPQLVPMICAEIYHLRKHPEARVSNTMRQVQRRAEIWNQHCRIHEFEAQAVADDVIALLQRVAALMAQTINPQPKPGLFVPPGPGGVA